MPQNKHAEQYFTAAGLPPPRRMSRSLVYIALGGAVFICVVCLLGAWIVLPHWSSPQQRLAFGSKGTGPGMLENPTYIGLDGHRNIYVGDWDDGRINVFDPAGKFLRLINVGTRAPILGMAVAPHGTLYVSYDRMIHRLTAQGDDTTLAYTDSRGDAAGPISRIGLMPDGSLAAADNSGDILRFGPDGTAELILAEAFDLPSFSPQNEIHLHDAPILNYDVPASSADRNISIAVDGAGNIYAVGWTIGIVLKTDSAGNSLSKFGGFAHFPGGLERGRFDFPDAMATDSYGHIYVGDSSGV